MALRSLLASDEAGTENFGMYSVTDAERDAEANMMLAEAEAGVEIAAQEIDSAAVYLDAMQTMIQRDKAISGAGTETFDGAASVFYGMAVTVFGNGDEAEMVSGGTEKKTSYYESAKLMAKNAWMILKKNIYKAIAKLIGYVNFRTGKIDSLVSEIEKSKSDAWVAEALTKDQADEVAGVLPGDAFVTPNLDIFKIVDGVTASKSKADVVKSFEVEIKTAGDKSFKKPRFGTSELGTLIKGELEGDDTYVVIPLVKKIKFLSFNKETGKVSYKGLNYPDSKSPENDYPIFSNGDAKTAIEEIKTNNKKFQDNVKKYFGIVDKAGKASEKAMDAFNETSKDDDDKAVFRAVKDVYALTPRVAFDQVLSVNQSINGGIKYLELSIEAHKKAAKDAKKTWK